MPPYGSHVHPDQVFNSDTTDKSDQICCGICLVIMGCLAASLASTHWMPIAPLRCNNQKYLQMWLSIPWGKAYHLLLLRLRTTDLDKSTPGYSQATQRLTLNFWDIKIQIQSVCGPNICKPCPIPEPHGWQIAKGSVQETNLEKDSQSSWKQLPLTMDGIPESVEELFSLHSILCHWVNYLWKETK